MGRHDRHVARVQAFRRMTATKDWLREQTALAYLTDGPVEMLTFVAGVHGQVWNECDWWAD